MGAPINIYRSFFLTASIIVCSTFTALLNAQSTQGSVHFASQYGINDTIVSLAVVYEGDTIEAKILAGVYVWGKRNARAKAEWTRLRNAIYVTYPYAKRAGWVFSDIENHIANNPNKKAVTK